MATDPETLTQLARLLGKPLSALRTAAAVQRALDQDFDTLIEGLVTEAAASDDVLDRGSALEFLEARLDDFRPWLSEEQRTRLLESLHNKIKSW